MRNLGDVGENVCTQLELLHNVCLQQGQISLAYVISTRVLSFRLLAAHSCACAASTPPSPADELAVDVQLACLEAGILVLRNGLALMPALQLLPMQGLDAIGLGLESALVAEPRDVNHLAALLAHSNTLLGVLSSLPNVRCQNLTVMMIGPVRLCTATLYTPGAYMSCACAVLFQGVQTEKRTIRSSWSCRA
jgi:hypothetical protein